MGMWDFEAWDNDSAADWFGGLMKKSNLRAEWLEAINRNLEDEYEVVRGAIWLFTQLGRVYIWPIDNYNDDLIKTITVAENLSASKWLNEEIPGYIENLKKDIIELKKRCKK